MVRLGTKVKDSITGFEGIAMGRAEYLYGCVQIMVVPEHLGEHGERLNGEWFDEPRLTDAPSATSGGPQPLPPGPALPPR